MPLALLRSLLETVGMPAELSQRVEIRGADPVLATRFRVGDAAGAALAAGAIAAGELWRLRGGRAQRVRVDVTGAAASLVGFAFQRLHGSSAGAAWEPRGQLTGLYPTRGGHWFLFHQSFPDTQAKALAKLGCAPERAALAACIAGWDAQALEDALAAIGCCGARVRSAEEWARHPQGQALAQLPVVEVTRVADGPPEPLGAGARPLDGVRALDLTRVLAGPTCGRTLAAHGAEVLRVGSPKLPYVPPFVMDTSHGKRSAYLDLREPGEAARLRELVRGADVFAQGYRSGALARLGFGPEELFELRPGLVYTAINCYGHEGPWVERPGWEQLAQAVSGIAHEHGGEQGPQLLPAAASDYNTGYLAALGTMVALARRAREGGSYLVRASLTQTAMWLARSGRCESLGAGLSREAVAPWLVESNTPFGRLSHLGPIAEMSETAPRWELPTVPLGTHAPEWAAPRAR